MGTYFALMEEAAKRGEEYQSLDRIREILLNIQKRSATAEEIEAVIRQLSDWKGTISKDFSQDPKTAVQAREALKRLADLESALVTAASAAHR